MRIRERKEQGSRKQNSEFTVNAFWDSISSLPDIPYEILKRPYFCSNWGLSIIPVLQTLTFVLVAKSKTLF